MPAPDRADATSRPDIADDQSVAGPIIETKIAVPARRSRLVERGRLAERLAAITSSRLTLVSAPPGFGKSTVVADWAREATTAGTAVAWVSLDAGDNDPGRFWSYVVAALRTDDAFVDVGTLVNRLSAGDAETVIVLDDLHVIENEAIHEDLAQLVDRLPANAHVVIVTRADPPLPLARLRARGELLEIRAADLRFAADEAAAFLKEVMGLELSGADVAALEARTEGWVAALQLAALSMTGREDVGAFVDAVRRGRPVCRRLPRGRGPRPPARRDPGVPDGDGRPRPADRRPVRRRDRAGRQPGGPRGPRPRQPVPRRRSTTSAAGTATTTCSRTSCARGCSTSSATLVPELHARASAWFEAHDDPSAAIEHALAAADFERAADLIEVRAHDLRQMRQEQTLRRWLDALPDSLFEHRPVLAITHVAARMSSGTLEGVEQRLVDAERWLPAARDEDARAAAVEAGMIVRQTAALSHLPSAIGLHRAGLAQVYGDFDATIRHVERDDRVRRRRPAARAWRRVRPARPRLLVPRRARCGARGMVAGDRHLTEAGHDADVLGCSIGLADIEITLGRLRDARATYERGIRLGESAPRDRSAAPPTCTSG